MVLKTYKWDISRLWFHFAPLVGTEELGHLEMIGAIVHQLTRNMNDAQAKDPVLAPTSWIIQPEFILLPRLVSHGQRPPLQ